MVLEPAAVLVTLPAAGPGADVAAVLPAADRPVTRAAGGSRGAGYGPAEQLRR